MAYVVFPTMGAPAPMARRWEMITMHYDKQGYLLALDRGYETAEKVLDALANDEFVPRP